MKRERTVYIIGITILLAVVFTIGHLTAPVKVVDKPHIVYSTNETVRIETMTLPAVTHTVNNTIKEVSTEIVYEEKIVNGKFKPWQSVGELADYVHSHEAQIFGNKDCDNYAVLLQQDAYEDGYAISCHLVYNGKLDWLQVSPTTDAHMGNIAIVKNEIYWIEAQDNIFRIVFVSNLD